MVVATQLLMKSQKIAGLSYGVTLFLKKDILKQDSFCREKVWITVPKRISCTKTQKIKCSKNSGTSNKIHSNWSKMKTQSFLDKITKEDVKKAISSFYKAGTRSKNQEGIIWQRWQCVILLDQDRRESIQTPIYPTLVIFNQ